MIIQKDIIEINSMTIDETIVLTTEITTIDKENINIRIIKINVTIIMMAEKTIIRVGIEIMSEIEITKIKMIKVIKEDIKKKMISSLIISMKENSKPAKIETMIRVKIHKKNKEITNQDKKTMITNKEKENIKIETITKRNIKKNTKKGNHNMKPHKKDKTNEDKEDLIRTMTEIITINEQGEDTTIIITTVSIIMILTMIRVERKIKAARKNIIQRTNKGINLNKSKKVRRRTNLRLLITLTTC
jgi:hypothetical protein